MIADLTDLATSIALACGRLIIDERPERLDVDTKSSATDVVTEMDRRSEALARAMLAEARPDDAVLGEEGATTAGSSGLTWVIDPIDGTVNYLYGIAHYAVSVAVVEGDPTTTDSWRPVAAAVVNPAADDLFMAGRGRGARRRWRGRETSLAFSSATSLAQSLCATGFAYDAATRAEQAAVVARVLPRVRDIRRHGSAALDLCHVASGSLDCYYERGLHPWDLAGGWLVATEAGAVVAGPGTHDPNRDLVIAGSRPIVAELRELVER